MSTNLNDNAFALDLDDAQPIMIPEDYTVRTLLVPIREHFSDPQTTEIRLKKPNQIVTVGFYGKRIHEVPFSEDKMNSLGLALATSNYLPTAPVNYLQLPSGERVTMFRFPAVTTKHYQFVFRKHLVKTLTLDELWEQGALSAWTDVSFNKPTLEQIELLRQSDPGERLSEDDAELLRLKLAGDIKGFLRKAVRCRKNMMVAGRTASGKSTFIRSLIIEGPRDEHICTLEDVHEMLLPEFPEVTHLMFGDGVSQPTAKDAMKLMMRISPDRIYPSEVRGDEAWDYFGALNNGHPGSISTTHANSAFDIYMRIFQLLRSTEAGRSISEEFLRSMLYSTIHVTMFMHDKQLTELFFDPMFSAKHKL